MKEHLTFQIWLRNCMGIFIPLAVYFILQNLFQIMTVSLLGREFYLTHSIALQGIGNLLLIPILYFAFCRRGSLFPKGNLHPKEFLLILCASICLSRGLNCLLGLSLLPRWFPAYEKVSAAIQREPFGIRLLTTVFTAPLLEELLMRGIVYGRLKEITKNVKAALLGSALLFGLFHGNLVQGIYAFFLGILFAWLLEQYHTLWAPVFAHAGANAASLLQNLLSERGCLTREWIPEALLTAALLLAGYFFACRIKASA